MSGNGIAKNAAVVGFMTFISRIGGLIREILMARFFGAGVEKSAFDVAYRIPNLFRRLFGEGALSAALIPIYTETVATKGRKEADAIAAAVAGIVMAILAVACVAGILATYAIAGFLHLDDRWLRIMPLARIMFPYAPLICLAAIVMGVLNSLGSFAVSALAPAFQNLCCIVALAAICPFVPAEGPLRIEIVSWSIVVSGVVQVAVQLPELRRRGVPLSLILPLRPPEGVRRVFTLMLPMALSAGVVQINVCLDSVLAMKAGEWGPSVLGYADRIVYLPLAMFGTAFSTVLLPTLSSFAAVGDYRSFSDSFSRSLRNSIVVLVPASAAMIALAGLIVSLIYESGAFDIVSTARTAVALIAYSAGLVAAGGHKMAVTALYAMKDSRTPVIVGTCGVALNLAMNLFFIWILPAEFKPVGIAIATSISSFVAWSALLAILARRSGDECGLFAFSSIGKVLVLALVSGVAMAIVCRAAAFAALGVFAIQGCGIAEKLKLLAVLAFAAASGTAAYLLLMRVFCPDALRELVADFRTRRRKV